VKELYEETRTVGMHRLCDAGQARHDLLSVAGQGVRCQQARGVDGGRLEDNQPGAAAGPGLVVGDEVIRRNALVDEGRLVRGGDDPVR
jgi:hypothetical protein